MHSRTPESHDDTRQTTIDLAALRQEDFEHLIGKEFVVPLDASDDLRLTLTGIDKTVHPGTRQGGGFSLEFSGSTDRYLLQGTVPVRFPDGRNARLFLVNTGPQGNHMRYQVVFG